MRRPLWAVVLLALLLPTAPAAPPAPGAACAPVPVTEDRESNDALGPVDGVTTEAGSQQFVVRWEPVPNAQGYRVRVHEGDDGPTRVFETSGVECRVSAVNGRLYAVDVAAIDQTGALAPASDPEPVRPAFENDFLFLTLGLLSVWAGLWLYAVFLVRQQRRLVRRYEALFKRPGAGGEP